MKFRITLILILTLALLSGCGNAETVISEESPEKYIKTMEYHDGFTVLQLTDIHWCTATQNGSDTYGCEKYIRTLIREAENHAGHIDLIEVTGDTFMLANTGSVEAFAEMMADIGIPYAMLWGNHDREGEYNPNFLTEVFETAPFSLYTEVDNDDVHERCNYVVDLIDTDGTVAWQLIQLDSGASYREKAEDLFLTYDYIREDQFSWLETQHVLAGDDVPAICYYHIPQADNDAAWEAVSGGAEGYKTGFFKLENFAASDLAPSTEEVFLDNNVKAAFMGHAHANDWTVTLPSGIVYGMGVKTGYELYYGQVSAGDTSAGFEVTEDMIISGASLVTLENRDGDFSLEHLYYNERDGEDLVMWVSY